MRDCIGSIQGCLRFFSSPLWLRFLPSIVACLLIESVASTIARAEDPIARWVADDWVPGASWIDRVGQRTAVAYGNPVKASGQFGAGQGSDGVVFDGIDDFFEVAANNNPIAGKKRVTIVALFKATQGATGTDGNHWQIPGPINAESPGEPNDFGLSVASDGTARAFFNGAIATPQAVSVTDGQPHTLILTWSDGDVGDKIARFYVDGILQGSLSSDGGNGIVSSLIRFGRERETTSRWFRGTIGELRFYGSIENAESLHRAVVGPRQLLINPEFTTIAQDGVSPLGWSSNVGFLPVCGGSCGLTDAKPAVDGNNLRFGYRTYTSGASSVTVIQSVDIAQNLGFSKFILEYQIMTVSKAGQYSVQADFLDSNGAVIKSLRYPTSGTVPSPASATTLSMQLARSDTVDFDRIRSAKITLQGVQQDSSPWSGHYGPAFGFVRLWAHSGLPASPTLSGQWSSIQVVADNDYALFAGNSSGLSRLIHQNGVESALQAGGASGSFVTLQDSESHIYLVAMGGGDSDGVQGLINGVDFTSLQSPLAQRAVTADGFYRNIAPYLTGYQSSTVISGAFSPLLADVTSGLAGMVWGAPPNPENTWLQSVPTAKIWSYPSGYAVVYRFQASALNLTPKPGNKAVTLEWSVPTDTGGSPITDYRIQYSEDGLQWTTFADAVSTATSATVTGLINGNTYRFRVAAINASGTGVNSLSSSAVTPANTPPVLAGGGGSLTATEQVVVPLDPLITVSDADDGVLASATVSITGAFQSGQDQLAYVNPGTHGNIASAYNSAAGVLTLTSSGATATVAQWQDALRSVTYLNTSDTPNTSARTVTWVVNDGTAFSAAVSKALTVNAVDDPPVATAQTVTVVEDIAKSIVLSGTDAEAATLTYSVVTQPTKGVLSGTAPNLTYTPIANFNGTDSFTFKVRDGQNDSQPATVSIVVSSVNDAPTLTLPVALVASGGERVEVDGYVVHTFRQGGTFTPEFSGSIEVLVVGGGGGGGVGGGGAGGVVYQGGYSVSASQAVSVTVGNGGAGGVKSGTVQDGVNGGDSIFGSMTAFGGGGGGGHTRPGLSGASSGGAGSDTAAAAAAATQGNPGAKGAANEGYVAGGGGGGAGAAGTRGLYSADGYRNSSSPGGNGGDGVSYSISGTTRFYGGGGGGGANNNTASPTALGGVGGQGGGGAGARSNLGQGAPGEANSGGGGGGGDPEGLGGAGGSGIVIVRYPARTLRMKASATAESFAALSGTVLSSDVETPSGVTLGIQGGVASSETGKLVAAGIYGTLQLDTASGAFTYLPNASVIRGLERSVVEKFTVTASDGSAQSTLEMEIPIEVAPATQLAITRQPARPSSNGALSTQPVVEIRDAQGNRTASTAWVTASIEPGSPGTLSGTRKIRAVGGIATFTDLSISGLAPGELLRLRFTAGQAASTAAGLVEWSYAVPSGVSAGISLLLIDQREFAAAGVSPAEVDWIQLLGVYTGPATYLQGDATWAQFSIPSALSGVAASQSIRVDQYGNLIFRAEFTFADRFAPVTSEAIVINRSPTLANGFGSANPAFSADFSTLPSNVTLGGAARLANGEVILTDAINSQVGFLTVNPFTQSSESFVAEFSYRAFDGSGADGTSFNYGQLSDNYGYSTVENGRTDTGLVVSLIEWSGQRVVAKFNGVTLFQVPFVVMSNNYRQVRIVVDGGGFLSVSIDGQPVNPPVDLGSSYRSANKAGWRFGFGSRTGGSNNRHSLDSLYIGGDIPEVFAILEDTPGNLAFYGTPFADLDGDVLTVTLSVDEGSLDGGVGDGIAVGGTSLARTFTGSVSALNTYFTTPGKVTYLAPSNASGSKTLTVSASDGSLSASRTAVLSVAAVNDVPVVSASQGSTAATEQISVVLDPAMTVSDVDNTTLASATVSVSGGFRSGEDVLGYLSGASYGNISGIYAAATGVLTLTSSGASATLAQWQAALRSVTYLNTSDAPSTAVRTITWVVNDGTGTSLPITKTVSVSAVNDAPVLATPAAVALEDTSAPDAFQTQTGKVVGTDVDSANLVYGITGGSGDQNTVSKTGSYGTLKVTIATGDYWLEPNAGAINALKADASQTFEVTVTDGQTTAKANLVVNLKGVNDAPVMTPITKNGTEDTPLLFAQSDFTAAYSDVEGDPQSKIRIASLPATVVLKLNGTAVTAGQEILIAALQSGSAGGQTGSSGLTYEPAANDSSAKSFTISAWDGNAWSAAASVTMNLVPVNDAPINTVPATKVVDEDQVLAFSGADTISVSDVDSTSLTTQLTVTQGTLTLTVAGTGATVSAGASGSATVSLTGTPSQVNAALASLKYQGNKDYFGADTLTVVTTDVEQSAGIDTDTVTLTVNPVNDLPTLNVPQALVMTEDVPGNVLFPASAFADVENDVLTVTLTVDDGSLQGKSVTGITLGGTPQAMSFNGSVAALNSYFSTAGNITYQGALNNTQARVLTTLVSDGGIALVPPVAGYARWFDASTLKLADGASVNLWPDGSGNASNAGQINGKGQPVYVANAGMGTGRGAVSFQANQALTFARDSAIRTVFSVFKGSSFLLTDAANYHFHRISDDKPEDPLWTPLSIGWTSPYITGGSTYLNGVLINGITTPMPTTPRNGFNQISVVTTGSVAADSFNRDRSYHSGIQSQAEVILYDRVLTDAERTWVEKYLAAKWFGTGSGVGVVGTSSVTFTPVNDAPVVAASQGMASAIEQVATAVDSGITVSDVDHTTLASATVSVSGGFKTGEDVLGYVNATGHGNISGSYAPATGVLTLTSSGATATLSQWQAALRSITYLNTSDTPTAADRTIKWVVSDGADSSIAATRTISVKPVNDPPANQVPATKTVDEDSALAFTGADTISVSDVDSASLTTKLTVAKGTLTVSVQASGATVSDGVNGSATISLTGTASQLTAALATLKYQANKDYFGADTLTVLTTDAEKATDTDTVALTVKAVNDAPFLAGVDVGGQEDTTLVFQTTDFTSKYSDTENMALASVTVVTLPATGVLKLSNVAVTEGQVVTAANLGNLSYQPAPDENGAKTFTVKASDGDLFSSVATVTMTLAPVNDAPVNRVPVAKTVDEDMALVFKDADAISVSDIDGSTLTTQLTVVKGTVTVTLGSTGAALSAGVNGSPTLSLTGTAAQVNMALATLKYQGTKDYFGTDVLTVLTTDAEGSTDTDLVALTVNPVNDAPILTAVGNLGYKEASPAVLMDPLLTISDVDDANLVSATVSIDSLVAGDVLGFVAQNGIAGQFDAAQGVLRLSGVASVATYQGVLRSVTFSSTSANPTVGGARLTRTVRWSATDANSSKASNGAQSSVSGDSTFTDLSDAAYSLSASGGNPYILSIDLGQNWIFEAEYRMDGTVPADLNTVFSYGDYRDGILVRTLRSDGLYLKGLNQGTLNLFGGKTTGGNFVPVRIRYSTAGDVGSLSIEVNGTVVRTVTGTAPLNPADKSIRIGSAHHANNEGFNGQVRNVRIVRPVGDTIITITGLNDSPQLTSVSNLSGGVEDTDYSISYEQLASASDASDVDSTSLSFRVEKVSGGVLTKDGAPVILGTTLLGPGQTLVWRPAANANGVLDAFTVRAWDGQSASVNPVTVKVTVAAVTDLDLLKIEAFLVGSGLLPVSDASGRYSLQASLGQSVAGTIPAVGGLRLDSGFWFADRLAEILTPTVSGTPTVAEAARGLMTLGSASASTVSQRSDETQSPQMASGIRFPEARLTVVPASDSARVRVQISGVPGSRWKVQSMDGLHADRWLDTGVLELNAQGAGFIETDAGGESAVRFYRLVQP